MSAIAALSHKHDMIINYLLLNPQEPLRNVAAKFGLSQSWLSCIIHSDAFQEELQQRQQKVASLVAQSIPEKLQVATDLAITRVTEALENTTDPDFALSAADKLLHRMGYAPTSARTPGMMSVGDNAQVTNVFMADPGLLEEARRRQLSLAAVQPMDELAVVIDNDSAE